MRGHHKQNNADSADMTGIKMTIQLTEIEFRSTFTDKMIDVTETAEPVVDIWPYVEQLTADKVVNKYTFDNALVVSSPES